MKFLMMLAVALGAVGVHAQSPAAPPQPAVASPDGASDKAKDPSPAPDSKVYRVGGSVKPPRLLPGRSSISKQNSEKMLSGKKIISSVVIVEIIVDKEGMPQSVKVLRSAGKAIDEAAVKSALEYRFEPAKKDGQPVSVVIDMMAEITIGVDKK